MLILAAIPTRLGIKPGVTTAMIPFGQQLTLSVTQPIEIVLATQLVGRSPNMKINHPMKMGSERGFGVVFSIVFAVVAIWPAWNGIGSIPTFDDVRISAVILSSLFLLMAFVAPIVLRPLNFIWFRFGLLLGAIIAPIVMMIIFLLVITPMGVIVRLAGHDLLKLKRKTNHTMISSCT